jgi:CheY-like chemotaxis protein
MVPGATLAAALLNRVAATRHDEKINPIVQMNVRPRAAYHRSRSSMRARGTRSGAQWPQAQGARVSKEASFEILLIDDDEASREAVVRGMRANGIHLKVVHATSGREALNLLRGKDPQRHIAAPLLILLDLNMPEMNGFEFLEELRGDEQLTRHVVFAVTTSERTEDFKAAYGFHIAGYVVKTIANRWHSRLALLLKAYQEGVRLPV